MTTYTGNINISGIIQDSLGETAVFSGNLSDTLSATLNNAGNGVATNTGNGTLSMQVIEPDGSTASESAPLSISTPSFQLQLGTFQVHQQATVSLLAGDLAVTLNGSASNSQTNIFDSVTIGISGTYEGVTFSGTISGSASLAATTPVVVNSTSSQVTLTAPLANSTVEGGGYDILNLSQNSIATTSSAYTLASNHNGWFTMAAHGSTDNINGVMQVQFSDKTLTVTATGSENEYIALLYQGALGRTPDAAGLAGWEKIGGALSTSTQALGVYGLSDASGNYNGSLSIAAGFTQSTEFTAKYGSLTNAQFVTQLYSNILDRAPDATGFAGWMAQLNAGESQAHVLVGFADSQEAINNATLGYTGQSGAHASWLFLT